MSKYDFPTQFEYRKTKSEKRKRKTKSEKRKTKSEKRKSNQLHLVIERICHICVTNAFEICDEFVRILHTL